MKKKNFHAHTLKKNCVHDTVHFNSGCEYDFRCNVCTGIYPKMRVFVKYYGKKSINFEPEYHRGCPLKKYLT